MLVEPEEILAFNWEDRSLSFAVKPPVTALWKHRPRTYIADFVQNHVKTLQEPEFIFRGLRNGVEVVEGQSIDGLCYTCRFKSRYIMGDEGIPVATESRGTETFAVFIDDERRIFDAGFVSCDWLGKPIGADARFAECLYDQNQGLKS